MVFLGYDCLFGFWAVTCLTWYAATLVALATLINIFSAVNIVLFKKKRSELKYSGIALQASMMLFTLLLLSSESMIVRDYSWKI